MFDLFSKKTDTPRPGNPNSKGSGFHVVDPREAGGHCLISGHLHIRGDVSFCGSLRIDGRVDGKVSQAEGSQGQLVISRGAVINGPVVAQDVIVDGTVSGDLMVDGRLECRSHAVLKGEVRYGSIHIADGAKIEARCLQKDQGPHLQTVSRSPRSSASISTLQQTSTIPVPSTPMDFLSKNSR